MVKNMADTTAAASLASSMRVATTNLSSSVHRALKPENVTASGFNVISSGVDGSSSSVQFDASGQIVPSAHGEKKNSATSSLVNLLA